MSNENSAEGRPDARSALSAELLKRADPAGCTQEPVNGARVECRAFHSDRIHRWCRSCLLREAVEKLDRLTRERDEAQQELHWAYETLRSAALVPGVGESFRACIERSAEIIEESRERRAALDRGARRAHALREALQEIVHRSRVCVADRDTPPLVAALELWGECKEIAKAALAADPAAVKE